MIKACRLRTDFVLGIRSLLLLAVIRSRTEIHFSGKAIHEMREGLPFFLASRWPLIEWSAAVLLFELTNGRRGRPKERVYHQPAIARLLRPGKLEHAATCSTSSHQLGGG